jgi:hypothetical protein
MFIEDSSVAGLAVSRLNEHFTIHLIFLFLIKKFCGPVSFTLMAKFSVQAAALLKQILKLSSVL